MFSGSLLSTHCQYLHSCQHDFEFQQYLWSRQSFPGQPNKYTYAGILWHTVEHLEFWGGANTLNSGGVISTTLSAVGPDDIPFTIQYINDNHWLKDFILDAKKANWDEWSLQVSFLTDRQGFTDWLDGSLAQPDKSVYPKAHHIWAVNDRSLKGFLYSHISCNDYRNIRTLATSHEIFEELRKTHEKQGLHAQLILIKKAMEIRYKPDIPLSKMTEEIEALHTHITNMGTIDNDKLKAVFMINALNRVVQSCHLLVCLFIYRHFTAKLAISEYDR